MKTAIFVSSFAIYALGFFAGLIIGTKNADMKWCQAIAENRVVITTNAVTNTITKIIDEEKK